jgi:hypothetical protein
MKILLSIAFVTAAAGSAQATITDRCAPLIANWVNASPMTCPENGVNDNKQIVSIPRQEVTPAPQASTPEPDPAPGPDANTVD